MSNIKRLKKGIGLRTIFWIWQLAIQVKRFYYLCWNNTQTVVAESQKGNSGETLVFPEAWW